MNAKTFYVITFDSTSTGRTDCSRTFGTLRAARNALKHYKPLGTNVRIMAGGPGGMPVS